MLPSVLITVILSERLIDRSNKFHPMNPAGTLCRVSKLVRFLPDLSIRNGSNFGGNFQISSLLYEHHGENSPTAVLFGGIELHETPDWRPTKIEAPNRKPQLFAHAPAEDIFDLTERKPRAYYHLTDRFLFFLHYVLK
ncbi:MAG: hypothetical protein NT075_16215 [Chloroflexi bacterium]|nr:hypothetical protein [Chloroflexota bacterium]